LQEADAFFKDVDLSDVEMVVLPGGMKGAEAMRDDAGLVAALKAQQARSRWIAAICASPSIVFATHGLFGAPSAAAAATCYPSPKLEEALPNKAHIRDAVVVDKAHKIITSRGPGTAVLFGLSIVETLQGADVAARVRDGLVIMHS
jgi:protein deglycase